MVSLQRLWPISHPDLAAVDHLDVYEHIERPPTEGRPWVICCMVASLDGAVSVGGRSGDLGSPADYAVLTALRTRADAVLVGAGTLRTEGYGQIHLSDEARLRRRRRGQDELPLLAVVSSSCDFDPTSEVWRGPRRNRLYTTSAAAPERLKAMQEVADVRVLETGGGSAVSAEAVVDDLTGDGLAVVLLEGGPTLNSHFARAGLLDELCLTLSPLLVGGGGGIIAGEEFPRPLKMSLECAHTAEGMLFTRYLRSGRGTPT